MSQISLTTGAFNTIFHCMSCIIYELFLQQGHYYLELVCVKMINIKMYWCNVSSHQPWATNMGPKMAREFGQCSSMDPAFNFNLSLELELYPEPIWNNPNFPEPTVTTIFFPFEVVTKIIFFNITASKSV